MVDLKKNHNEDSHTLMMAGDFDEVASEVDELDDEEDLDDDDDEDDDDDFDDFDDDDDEDIDDDAHASQTPLKEHEY